MIHETSDPQHAKISEHKAIRNDLALMFQLGVVRSQELNTINSYYRGKVQDHNWKRPVRTMS